MNGTQDPKVIQIGSPAELLSAVPGLVGFTPEQSLVIIGAAGERNRVQVTLRYDLPDPTDIAAAEQIVAHAVSVLVPAGSERAVAVVYGPEDDAAVLIAAELVAQDELPVFDVLRADGGRYWSYGCIDEECCPSEGTPFEVQIPADFHAILADRQALADTIAPVTGDAAEAMRKATQDAVAHAKAGWSRAAALALVQDLIADYRDGDQPALSDDEAARASVALRSLRIRDDAWSRMDLEHNAAHLALWSDLTRKAQPGYVAAPASLLAFVAWQAGNGALANLALDRALADSPDYSMADLLRQVITSGAPPSMARLLMTPEEVAASYDEQQH